MISITKDTGCEPLHRPARARRIQMSAGHPVPQVPAAARWPLPGLRGTPEPPSSPRARRPGRSSMLQHSHMGVVCRAFYSSKGLRHGNSTGPELLRAAAPGRTFHHVTQEVAGRPCLDSVGMCFQTELPAGNEVNASSGQGQGFNAAATSRTGRKSWGSAPSGARGGGRRGADMLLCAGQPGARQSRPSAQGQGHGAEPDGPAWRPQPLGDAGLTAPQ